MKKQHIDDMEIYSPDEKPLNVFEVGAMVIVAVGVFIIVAEFLGLTEFLIGLVK